MVSPDTPSEMMPSANPVQRWEYRLVTAPGTTAGEQWADLYLNPLGEEGWEAIAVLPAGDDLRILLKRPKYEPAHPMRAAGGV